MAVGTGTAANLGALLQAVVTFAVNNCGFTDEGTTTGPTGATTSMYRISKGGFYWYFVGMSTTVNSQTAGYIMSRCQNALPTSTNYNATANGPQYQAKTDLFYLYSGPFDYKCFSDGKSVFLSVKLTTGIYTHLAFGSVTKFGTWAGGEYVTGSYCGYWSTGWSMSSNATIFDGGSGTGYNGGHVRNARNSYGDYRDWAYIGGSIVNNQMANLACLSRTDNTSSIYNRPMTRLLHCAGNGFNGRTILLPMYLFLYDPTTTSRYLAGYVDNVAAINMTYCEAESLLETEWRAFPIHQKSGDTLIAPVTGFSGIAYKEVS